MSDNERCGLCRFWKLMFDDNEQGQCRRFPPANDANVMRYPVTYNDEWCGEFQRRTDNDDAAKAS